MTFMIGGAWKSHDRWHVAAATVAIFLTPVASCGRILRPEGGGYRRRHGQSFANVPILPARHIRPRFLLA